jgi:predicted DNA repair protein MutK
MPSGLIALLDDVATIAKLAAASIDDVAGAAGKASTKAAGVVIDDTAVTPRYVIGLDPERELPIIGKIAMGSLKNKMLILLPGAMLLTAFAPWGIIPILMLGGSYLAFEAAEKIAEKLLHEQHHKRQLLGSIDDPKELEELQVKGAIRTDLILSAEIMAIALANLETRTLGMTAAALAAVAFAITIGVYGAVALIVKLDDIGLHLAKQHNGAARRLGNGLVKVVPRLLSFISGLGTAAMLWVGGGILVHGFDKLHILTLIPETIHHLARQAGAASGGMAGVVEWVVNALGGALVGLVIGGIIAAIVRQLTRHPEEFVVE